MALFPSLKVRPVKQSNHDLSHKRRVTLAPGVLYPLLTLPVVSGDKVKISIESLIKTYPALSPIMGSFKLQADVYYSPLSLYNQRLHHNNALGYVDTSNMQDVNFPCFFLPNGRQNDSYRCAPDSLLRFLGFPSGYTDFTSTSATAPYGSKRYNAIPLLMYLDIFRNYYANRQERYAPVYNVTSANPSLPSATGRIDFRDLDAVFTSALDSNIDSLPVGNIPNSGNTASISDMFLKSFGNRLGGLLGRCYLPDVKNVILNNTLASAVGNATSVSTAGDSFTIDQFNLARKLYKVHTLTQLAGNRFSEWLRAQYAVQPDIRIDMPTFIGSTSTDVVFEDVVSTAESYESGVAETPLGALAGRGRGYMDGKTHAFTAPQPGYIQVIVSLIPRVDYYQFVHRYLLDVQLSDLFVNELNGLGLQDVLGSDLNAVDPWFEPSPPAWTDATNPFTKSYGKQPAWVHLMTAVNEVFGDFSESSLRGWTLARNMGEFGKAPSAYIDPGLFNYAFADTSSLAENFLAQFAFTIYKRSNVSKRLMPTV